MNILFLSSSKNNALIIIDPINNLLIKQGISWEVKTNESDISDNYDLIYLLSYNKIISKHNIEKFGGRILVFHSSDLPYGRGWAPIYNAMIGSSTEHTITLCYAATKVDSGNILLKARLPIGVNYNASMLRNAGRNVISSIISKYTEKIILEKPYGCSQPENGSYVKSREPGEAYINTSESFLKLVPHMLASEEPNLAFFDYMGERFRVKIVPENKSIQSNFVIEEYFSGKTTYDAIVPCISGDFYDDV